MARQEGSGGSACSEEGAVRELWLQRVIFDRLRMMCQERSGGSACSEEGAVRELWLQQVKL